ncbi:MAG: hypothetical protein JO141_19225 [Bradyrhizobium sp.]|nr:hypothetical protein [Bradyrhizobium sp.]
MTAAGKDETVRLGFGADDKVKIERSVLKRNYRRHCRPRPTCTTSAAYWNERSRPNRARPRNRMGWPRDKGGVMVPAG